MNNLSDITQIINDEFIHNVICEVISIKNKKTNIDEILNLIKKPPKYSYKYRKVYAYYIWNKIIKELINLRLANCLNKAFTMYSIVTLFDWDISLYFCIPKNLKINDKGHVYVKIYNDVFGYDNKIDYEITLIYNKDGYIYGNT